MFLNGPVTSKRSTREEAGRIFRAIFGGSPSAVVVERFLVASDLLNSNSEAAAVEAYYDAIARVADLEALEIAARYRHRLDLLCKKFLVMVYLAETVPENQQYFVKRRRDRAGTIAALFFGATRTAFKFVKGIFLLGRATRA